MCFRFPLQVEQKHKVDFNARGRDGAGAFVMRSRLSKKGRLMSVEEHTQKPSKLQNWCAGNEI